MVFTRCLTVSCSNLHKVKNFLNENYHLHSDSNYNKVMRRLFSYFNLVIAGACLAWFSQFLSFDDSEIWGSAAAGKIIELWDQGWFFSRISHYIFLNLFSCIPLFSEPQLLNARFASSVVSCFVLFLTSLLCYRITQKYWWSYFAGLFLFLNPFYLHQSIRIRSDLFCVLILLLITVVQKPFFKKVLFVLAFLSTPKSIILSAIFFPFFSDKPNRQALYLKGFVTLLLCAGLMLFAIPGLYTYFVHSLSASNEGPGLFSLSSFYYFIRLASLAPWLFVLFFIVLYLKLKTSPRSLTIFERQLDESFLVSIFAFLINPEKTPFFLVSLLPIWTLWIVTNLANRSSIYVGSIKFVTAKNINRFYVCVSFLALILVADAFFAFDRYQNRSNQEQIEAIATLDSYLASNQVKTYFDGIGLNPARLTPFLYIGPHDPYHKEILSLIEKNLPEVIVYTKRLQLLEPELSKRLASHYIYSPKGVFVKKYIIHQPITEPQIMDFFSKTFSKWSNFDGQMSLEIIGQGSLEKTKITTTVRQAYQILIESAAEKSTYKVISYSLVPNEFVFLKSLTDIFQFDTKI